MKVKELFEKRFATKAVATSTAISALNQYCGDALWMLHSNKPIWRGDDSMTVGKGGFAIADPSTGNRRSANTSNHYTLIFDNHPDMKDWPKRSKSFIAAYGGADYATGYGELYAVIPFNGVKIGCVNKKDMFYTRVDMFGKKREIADVNDIFADLEFSDKNWESFVKDVENFDPDEHSRENVPVHLPANLMAEIKKQYSPAATGFTLRTTKDLQESKPTEVWIGGKCVFIEKSVWDDMRRMKDKTS